MTPLAVVHQIAARLEYSSKNSSMEIWETGERKRLSPVVNDQRSRVFAEILAPE
jgi:hypothetical protein